MLTLESRFSEYVEALRKAGACAEVMAFHDEMIQKTPDMTVGDAYKIFYDDPKFEDGWCEWALNAIGRELDVNVRTIIINKIKSAIIALKVVKRCVFLTTEEITLLQDKYEGSGDVAKALICLEAIQKNQEFNTVRVEAVATCKSVSDAKTLLESKTDFTTAMPTDTSVKSADELKKILESERTKVTLATNLVMKNQGFVDVNENGSVAVFQEWYEGLK